MTGVLIGREESHYGQGGGHGKGEAEVGAMHLQAKEQPGLPACVRLKRDVGRIPSRSTSRRSQSCRQLLDLGPQELRENQFPFL